MKKITLLLVSFWLMTAFVIAQTPQAFKYQAVARNSTGNLIQNQLVAFRISILQGSPSGTLLYQERHTTNTNNYGLANLDIGNGTVLSGIFSSINWSLGQMYIKVELDPLGGTAYQNMGTSQLLSVPYALYSNTSAGLTLPYSGSGSSSTSTLSVTNTGTGNGISGTATNSSGYGIYGTAPVTGIKGVATNGSGENYGVYGQSTSAQGYGVYGKVTASVGVNYGVYGEAPSELGYGVNGTGGRSGVIGNGSTEGATGVAGINSFETGNGIGVWGLSSSVSGIGIRALATSLSGINYGVYSTTTSPTGFGIFGSGPVTGIKGEATIGSGESYGVYGIVSSLQGYGVYGKATAISGYNYGVYGESQSIIGTGVYGLNSTLSGGWCSGVVGKSTSSTGMGVYGLATSATGQTRAVRGYVASDDGYSGYFEGGRFYVEGNVGIGMESPSQALSIKTSTAFSSANFLNLTSGTSSTDGLMIGINSSSTAYLMNYENMSLNLGTNGSTRIHISSSGLVGIGTGFPSYLLDVAGPVNLNKGLTGIAIRCDGDEALWYNGTYFSWGYGGTYNFFGNKLKIAGNGNVAPAYELYVDGNAAKSLGGSTWIVSSDLRLKNLKGIYTKGLDEIIALQPVSFSYKAGNPRGLPSDVEQVGFVAQEVQKIFPEAITEGEDGLFDFNMHPINVALVNAIKELKADNDQLKAENDQLKAENEKINARLDKIEAATSLSAAK